MSYFKRTEWTLELGPTDGEPERYDRISIVRAEGTYDVRLAYGDDAGDSARNVPFGAVAAFIGHVLANYPLSLGARADLVNMLADITKEADRA